MRAIGCLERVSTAVMGALVCGGLTVAGVSWLRTGSDEAKNAEAVARLKPLSMTELSSALEGDRVLTLGRIDPRSPVLEPERGLVMYVKERCEMKKRVVGGGKRLSTSYTWTLAEKALPPFQLLAGEASMSILGRSYDLRRPSLDEPRRNGSWAVRFQGFRAGDLVLVDGRKSQGRLQADVVFGGDYETYVGDLRTGAPASRKLGWSALALAALVAVLAVRYIGHYRPPVAA